jgi:hypothetical protein
MTEDLCETCTKLTLTTEVSKHPKYVCLCVFLFCNGELEQERDYRRQQKALRAARKKEEEEKAAALVAKAAADKEAALESRRCHKFAVLTPEPDPGSNITRVI